MIFLLELTSPPLFVSHPSLSSICPQSCLSLTLLMTLEISSCTHYCLTLRTRKFNSWWDFDYHQKGDCGWLEDSKGWKTNKGGNVKYEGNVSKVPSNSKFLPTTSPWYVLHSWDFGSHFFKFQLLIILDILTFGFPLFVSLLSITWDLVFPLKFGHKKMSLEWWGILCIGR